MHFEMTVCMLFICCVCVRVFVQVCVCVFINVKTCLSVAFNVLIMLVTYCALIGQILSSRPSHWRILIIMIMIVFTSRLPSSLNAKVFFALYCMTK